MERERTPGEVVEGPLERAGEGMAWPRPSRRALLRGAAWATAGAAVPGLLEACSSNATAGAGQGNFPSHPKWKFVFVNHVTTNPFFVPTQYGLQDASALLGIPTPQWAGSASSNIPQMVSAMTAAISAGVNGITVAVISPTAFTTPTANALSKGIPVVSYNADGNAPSDKGTARLAYYG